MPIRRPSVRVARLTAAERRDFRLFLIRVWAHLGLPRPTPIQFEIARWLQMGPRRKLVLAFRGVGKTGVYAAYLCWRLACEPDAKVLVVSATQPAAEAISAFARRLIREVPALAALRPRPGRRDGACAFDVGPARAAKDPSVRALGLGGQLTGARADEILADDVETPSTTRTAAARARLAEAVREFDAVIRPGGRIAFLGTPQAEDSLYGALRGRGYAARVWPAEVPADAAVYVGALAPSVAAAIAAGVAVGAPLEPTRFPAADLAARRASYGAAGYAQQFLLDPRGAERLRHPLAIADLIVAPLSREHAPAAIEPGGPEHALEDLVCRGRPGDRFRGPASMSAERIGYDDAVLSIDPAGRGADETGWAMAKRAGGRMFLLGFGGFDGGYDAATLARLAAIAADFGARRVVIEANFGDGMFAALLAPALRAAGVSARVEQPRASGPKERRIAAALEPLLAQRRLVVDRDAIAAEAAETDAAPHRSVFHQLARLTRDPGALGCDDRLDALALAATALGSALAAATTLAPVGASAAPKRGAGRRGWGGVS